MPTVPTDAPGEDAEDDDSAAARCSSAPSVLSTRGTSPAAIAIAFLLSKAITYGWTRLALVEAPAWRASRRDCDARGGHRRALARVLLLPRREARTLAEEVADRAGARSRGRRRDEVSNSTFVVIVTTFVSTDLLSLSWTDSGASSPTWSTELERVCRPSQKKRPCTAETRCPAKRSGAASWPRSGTSSRPTRGTKTRSRTPSSSA